MLVIRPVQNSDLDDLFRLSQLVGSGMTSMPQDRDALARNIKIAEESFARILRDSDDYFLLVMEDTDKQAVIGTAAVYAKTGSRQAFYAYRLMSVTHYSHSLEKESRSGLLHLTNDYTDSSEVGTLFLDPEYRGNGHWLSRSRYMLMAQHPERFAPDVIAEMRGWIDDSGESPFWNAIGAHFFDMTYDEADQLCGKGSNQFITELMPKYPIYTNLLPQPARESLGVPRKETKRAMDLLLDEGFVYENMIDIFDGGPLLRAEIKQLKSVKAVRRARINATTNPPESSLIMSNRSLKRLRLIYQPARLDGDQIEIMSDAMKALGTRPGDEIMVIDENLV